MPFPRFVRGFQQGGGLGDGGSDGGGLDEEGPATPPGPVGGFDEFQPEPPPPIGYPDAQWDTDREQWVIREGDEFVPIGGDEQLMGNVSHRTVSRPAPQYFNDDAMAPRHWSTADVRALQSQLVDLGLLGNYSPGTWDETSASAYSQVLARANYTGMSADRAILNMEAVTEEATDRHVRPLTVQLTPTADLRNLFRTTSMELTGEGMSRDQVDRAIAAYHDIERGTQRSVHEARTNADPSDPNPYGPGGEVETAPSPDAFLEERVRAQDPLAVEEHNLSRNTQEVMQLLSQPAWGIGLGSGR